METRRIKILKDDDSGNIFAMRLVAPGELRFPGSTNTSVNGDGWVVQFYDCDHAHTDLGQFTAGYYTVGTFMDGFDLPTRRGLTLYGSEPKWTLCPDTRYAFQEFLNEVIKEIPELREYAHYD